jgi:hypothetical protein
MLRIVIAVLSSEGTIRGRSDLGVLGVLIFMEVVVKLG